MPRKSLHTLIWSRDRTRYEWFTHGHLEQCFRQGEEGAWLRWLEDRTAFSFQGTSCRLHVYKEARQRGQGYWYAYYAAARRNAKRYLGRTATVTLARLEEVAKTLDAENQPATQMKNVFLQTSLSTAPDLSLQNDILWLQTKFLPPRLPLALVERQRLFRELDAALSHPLILLAAYAGSGKTTLLAAWAAASTHQIAWLSLDVLDNNPTRFWHSVIVALRYSSPALSRIGEMALVMLSSPQSPSFSTILTTLLNDILSWRDKIVLILDDYHVIDDQSIHEAMIFLLDHIPSNLRLILSSRTDPELPLSRLRMKRRMTEMREQHLRFTSEETISFLRQGMDLPLTQEDMAILAQRTEGWIAGLQLAALSMRQHTDLTSFVQAFTGSHRHLLDYVRDEILQCQTLPIQRFLLRVAVLTRMNAAICEALTQDPTSQLMLELLERNHLFVIPLDEQRQWYRLHDLFREVLLARLYATEPEQVPLLHQQAAHWYNVQGDVHEAITHALAAADYSFAASLIERAAGHLWRSGEASTVLNWVMALPDTVLLKHARFALNAAYRLQDSLYLTSGTVRARTQTQVERSIVRIEEALRLQLDPALSVTEVDLIQRRLRLLRCWIVGIDALIAGNTSYLSLLVQETQALVEEEEVTWKLIPCILTFALRETLQRSGALLVPMLQKMKQEVSMMGDHLLTLRVIRMLAHAYGTAGLSHMMWQECIAGLELVKQAGIQTSMAAYLYYYLSLVYYDQNRLEESLYLSQTALDIARVWQQVDMRIAGLGALIFPALALGDFDLAEKKLQEMDKIQQRLEISYYKYWVDAIYIYYWLKTGKLLITRQWTEQAVFYPQSWDPNQKWALLAQVQVYLAQQQYTRAIEILERFSEQLDQPGDVYATIQFLALYVVASFQVGKLEQARVIALRLLSMTEPQGYIRIYLDQGTIMRQVLNWLLDTDTNQTSAFSHAFVSRLLTDFEKEEQRHQPEADVSLNNHRQLPHSTTASTSSLPLSPQEQRVLRLLGDGLTYAEMAKKLVVSLNTIKTHVSNIYGKLGVSRRAGALALGRRLHLL
jgi:LuxR family maltose regulon positive regulatory protein